MQYIHRGNLHLGQPQLALRCWRKILQIHREAVGAGHLLHQDLPCSCMDAVQAFGEETAHPAGNYSLCDSVFRPGVKAYRWFTFV